MEGMWSILKQRVCKRIYNLLEGLKEVLQDEWSKINMEEVRARISDMPRRCQDLVKTGEKAIKTALW